MTIPEFQLTHVALVGARMALFRQLGFHDRNELATRRVLPPASDKPLDTLPEVELRATLAVQLPIWVHNIIADPDFPNRHKLLMPLRRFEGELSDSKSDEVVATVLSAGFRNLNLDPLQLPEHTPLRERCAILMHIGIWQEAYRALEQDLVDLLATNVEDLARWVKLSSEPGYAVIEEA